MSNVVQKNKPKRSSEMMAVRSNIDIICQQANLATWVNILAEFIFFDVAILLPGYYSTAKTERS